MRSSVPASPAAAAMLVLCLSCALLLAGCGAGRDAATEKGAGTGEVTGEEGAVNEVELEPANGSGASGTATFSETSEGIEVTLLVRGLPEAGATYLAHVHPGTCADEGGEERAGEDAEGDHEGEAHGGETEHGHDSDVGEIEYPLEPITPDAGGNGSSTTVLQGVTAGDLFSGEPGYVNVHASGSGDPPALMCGDL